MSANLEYQIYQRIQTNYQSATHCYIISERHTRRIRKFQQWD